MGLQEAGLELAVQTITGSHSSPSGVPGGTAGLVVDDSLPTPLMALSLTGPAGATWPLAGWSPPAADAAGTGRT